MDEREAPLPRQAAPLFRALSLRPDAVRRFEVMSCTLVWDDEIPAQLELWLSPEDYAATFGVLRILWAHRAALVLGRPTHPADVALWEQMERHCPRWPGLAPERRTASLRAAYERAEMDALAEVDRHLPFPDEA